MRARGVWEQISALGDWVQLNQPVCSQPAATGLLTCQAENSFYFIQCPSGNCKYSLTVCSYAQTLMMTLGKWVLLHGGRASHWTRLSHRDIGGQPDSLTRGHRLVSYHVTGCLMGTTSQFLHADNQTGPAC